jgi:RNA polymerase sigma-70 factor (ECF subfamily)
MDRVLVERAVAGDRGAFGELARASIGRLFAVAQLILRDADLAADATQDTLVAAWRDLSALREPDRFDAWLHRILVRTCRREARRHRRRRTVEVRELPLDDRADVDELPRVFDRDQLERGFRRLDVEERALVVLHYVEGFSISEVALILGLPLGTAKSRLHRSLQSMRAALDADGRVVSIDRKRIA